MREAARALDDVSDHLGEVLRHADELLAEWARFGGQVRAQVEREAEAIGGVVDAAVTRAAAAGIDQAIAERLRGLTAELERLEQRARAASRAAAEQRETDRRALWAVVAGVVIANVLLVILVLRKPEVAPVPEAIRVEAPARAVEPADQAPSASSLDGAAHPSEPTGSTARVGEAEARASEATGSGDAAGSAGRAGDPGRGDAAGRAGRAGAPVESAGRAGASVESAGRAGAPAGSAGRAGALVESAGRAGAPVESAGRAGAPAGSAGRAGDPVGHAGEAAGSGTRAGDAMGSIGRGGEAVGSAGRAGEATGSGAKAVAGRPMAAPVALPPKAGGARVHKKSP
jgi:hypothetical protein